MYKPHHSRTTFGSCDVEKVHAVAARSTFPSQNVQSTPVSDHFWKLRCLKSARRCGAKQISKSKCTKHTSVGPLLEVAMSKKCTPFWREAHFQVKMYKTHQVRTTLEVAMSKKCTPLWREAHFEVKMYKTHQVRTTFGSCDVEKVHAVVARSAFPSQKCTKHTSFGPLLEVEMSKKCTPLWREAHFEVKMYKTHQVRTTFGSCDVEKVHAVVARSAFPSQNVQNTPVSDHFWKLRCQKSARRCGAKHISKSKCTKHHMFAPLLEVRMLKKCTPLWREAHSQVKMYKTPHVRATFGSCDVEKVHAVVARSTFRSQNVQLQLQLHSTTLHYTNLHYAKLHYTTLHYTALHYIPLHSTTLHYSTLHYIRLDDTAP